VRRRDWAGSVLVAALLALTGLLHSHTAAAVAFGCVAAGGLAVVAYDVGHEHGSKKVAEPVPADSSEEVDPSLSVVQIPSTHSRVLGHSPGSDGTGGMFIVLYASMWVSNPHHRDLVRILKVRLDDVVLGQSLTRWSDVPGQLWETNGGTPPIEVHPRTSPFGGPLEVACSFNVTPHGDGKGGYVNPESVAGNIVFIDQFNVDHEAGRFVWQ
jgi:hypothetical protein